MEVIQSSSDVFLLSSSNSETQSQVLRGSGCKIDAGIFNCSWQSLAVISEQKIGEP